MHQTACIYVVVPQQKWNNTCLETKPKLEGGYWRPLFSRQRANENQSFYVLLNNALLMFKCVEIFCSFKRVRGFAPCGWTNVRQRHSTCVDFTEWVF